MRLTLSIIAIIALILIAVAAAVGRARGGK